jgi:hypothetical protein
MSFLSVALPPGLYRNGTIYQSKGRYYDANLIRFRQGEVGPINGWQLRSASASAFSGAARAIINWRDNSGNRWVAVGTSSKLYVQTEAGTNYDITPAGFTSGRDDASQNLGYGGGTYGTGYYGAPRPTSSAYLAATVWTLDTFGQDLVGCADTDGKLYEWTTNTGTPAAVITNAPTSCKALVVTPENFIFALGASANGRRVAWCDQEADTVWTASATNQAGDQDLQTSGTLMCGRPMKGLTLLLTDTDAWIATYLGPPYVYGFQRVGTGCGIVAKGAVAARDTDAAWMGSGGFWLFDGVTLNPLDCDVRDAVFSDINTNQISKVTAVHLSAEREVWWFFPSAASNENDRFVCWAYGESQRVGRQVWTMGTLTRTCGSPKGVFSNPLMVSASGYLYEHETGWNYDSATPYLESGPIELGSGGYLMQVQRIIPDELANGDVTLTAYVRSFPNGPETTFGPYTLTSPTDVWFQGALMRLRYTGASLSDWRIGNFRLDVEQGDPLT